MRPAHILIHFDELGLRRRGRTQLERLLRNHVNRMLPPMGTGKVRLEEGRMTVPLDDAPLDRVLDVLERTPGISWFAPVHKVEKRVDAFRDAVVALAAAHSGSFRVTVKRATRRFPVTSMEVARQMGAAVVSASGRPVDLHNAMHDYRLEIADRGAYLYTERRVGWGGMPPRSAAPIVVLASGGVDSAVAAFRLARRGCIVHLVHFSNARADVERGERVADKLQRLAAALSLSQADTVLHAFDFGAEQQRIADAVFGRDRVLAYRIAMTRVAARVAERVGAAAIATGDVIAQTPSQSIARIAALGAHTPCPILTPVAGDRREGLLEESRRLRLREITALPYEDVLGFGAGCDGREPLEDWLVGDGGAGDPMADVVAQVSETESIRAWRFGNAIDDHGVAAP